MQQAPRRVTRPQEAQRPQRAQRRQLSNWRILLPLQWQQVEQHRQPQRLLAPRQEALQQEGRQLGQASSRSSVR